MLVFQDFMNRYASLYPSLSLKNYLLMYLSSVNHSARHWKGQEMRLDILAQNMQGLCPSINGRFCEII